MAGILYIVATPIGNLEDVTLRSLRILKEVDLIACEDTRHTLKLLNHYEIKKPLVSYFEHNQVMRTPQIVAELQKGRNIALVSDAGTPAISDPGFPLVREAISQGVLVVPIPGPSAVITALCASGLPTDKFLFVGFLPPKSGRRQRSLTALKEEEATLVIYESPHHILRTLEEASEVFGQRSAVLAREQTKIHETFLRGTLWELRDLIRQNPPKGEIVLLIAGKR